MADLTKSSNLGFDPDSLMRCVILGQGELLAGEAISEMDACYIKSDGKVYKAVTTVTTMNGLSDFDGFAYKTYASGDPVSIIGNGAIVEYAASGLTPGAPYYVSDTAGKVSDVPVTSVDAPIAKAISATRMIVQSLGRVPDIIS